MSKLGLFCDISNLYNGSKKVFDGGLINYKLYREWLEEAEQTTIHRSWAYGYQSPVEHMAKFVNSLEYLGFETKFLLPPVGTTKRPNYLRWDIMLTVDAIKHGADLDTIVIGSSDSNLEPLVQYLRDKQKRVVIYAARISRQLKSLASAFYEVEEECINK